MASEKVVWNRWQVVAVVVFGLATTPLAIAQLYQILFPPAADLVVASEYEAFELPPGLVEKVKDLGPNVGLLPSPNYDRLQSYFRFTVTNKGDVPASEFRVKWKPKAIVLVTWDNGKQEKLFDVVAYEATALRNGETVTFALWPIERLTESPEIFYVGGSMKVPISTARPARTFSEMVVKVLTGAGVVFILVILALLVSAVRAARKATRQAARNSSSWIDNELLLQTKLDELTPSKARGWLTAAEAAVSNDITNPEQRTELISKIQQLRTLHPAFF